MPYSDPEKRRAHRRKWYAANREERRAYGLAWEHANKDKKAAYYQANKAAIIEKNTERDKAKRAANRLLKAAKAAGFVPDDRISIHPEEQKARLVARDNERIAKRLEDDEVLGPEEAGRFEQRAEVDNESSQGMHGPAIGPHVLAREVREVAGMVAALLDSPTYDAADVYRLAVANLLPYSIPALERVASGAPSCAPMEWRAATEAERAVMALHVVRLIVAERERAT